MVRDNDQIILHASTYWPHESYTWRKLVQHYTRIVVAVDEINARLDIYTI